MIVSDDACYDISVLWKPIRRINHLSSRRGEQQSAWRKALRAINRRLGKIEDSEDDSRKGAKVAKFGEKMTRAKAQRSPSSEKKTLSLRAWRLGAKNPYAVKVIIVT